MNEFLDYIKNRVLAYIVDLILVILFIVLVRDFLYSILIVALDSSSTLFLSTVFSGFTAPVAYFALLEKYFGTTVGKKLYTLVVVDEIEKGVKKEYKKISLMSALIRSLSKISIELTILDYIIGMATNIPEQQRLLDRLAKTRVIPGPDPGYTRSEQKTVNAFKLIFTITALFFFGVWIITRILSVLEGIQGLY